MTAMRSGGAVCVILVAGCGMAGDASETSAWPVDDLSLLEVHEELRLGDVDDPDAGFSRIQGYSPVAVDRYGRTYVFEWVDSEIRVFDPEGRELRRIGRRGHGPGEFPRPMNIGIVGDTLWAMEQLLCSVCQLRLFTLEGDLIHSSQVDGIRVQLMESFVGSITPQYLGSDGYFVSFVSGIAVRPDRETSGLTREDTILVPRIRFDLRGQVVDTIGWDARIAELTWGTSPPPVRRFSSITVGSLRFRVPLPFPDHVEVLAVSDGRILVDRPVATGRRRREFAVTRLAFNDDTIFHKRYSYQPVEYTNAILDTIVTRESRNLAVVSPSGTVGFNPDGAADNPDSLLARRALRRALDFPPFQPPIQSVWMDCDERLWLRREDTGEAMLQHVLLDADGTPLGVVELPRTQRIVWSRGSSLWTVDTDEWGVPWLVRYAFVVP